MTNRKSIKPIKKCISDKGDEAIMKRDVNAMKEWFKNGKGCELVKQLLPEQENMIRKYLNIPQSMNRKEISGVYYFSFVKGGIKHSAYIGEAGNIYFRLLEHLYNLFNNITEWGISPESILNGSIGIDWVYETGISGVAERRKIEREAIEKFKPFLQYTAPDSCEYGEDKNQYAEPREKVRPDYCVNKDLRRKRAAELFYTNAPDRNLENSRLRGNAYSLKEQKQAGEIYI